MIDRDGYIKTYAPDHPFPRRGGYILEHVRKVEIKIGRRIGKNECVHHVDGDRQNNNIDNLILMQKSKHSSEHRRLDYMLRSRDNFGRFS